MPIAQLTLFSLQMSQEYMAVNISMANASIVKVEGEILRHTLHLNFF